MKGRNKIVILLGLMALTIGTPDGSVFAQKLSPSAYIERYKDAAIQHMEEHGCPASIILAVAMHESAHGNSRVARYLNNHFGIKGPNQSKEIRSAYKGYDSVTESYGDFVALLKRRKATKQLFVRYQPHQYRQWVRGIARSGYALSPTWSTKVIGMIEKYKLYELDRHSEGEHMVAATEQEAVGNAWYTVKPGDTLYDLARKHGTTIAEIRQNNGLATSRLHIGQRLLL